MQKQNVEEPANQGMNQIYPAKSSPVHNIFYMLNLILCATVEHLVSKQL